MLLLINSYCKESSSWQYIVNDGNRRWTEK